MRMSIYEDTHKGYQKTGGKNYKMGAKKRERWLCEVNEDELHDAIVQFVKDLRLTGGSVRNYNLYNAIYGEHNKARKACIVCYKKKCAFRTESYKRNAVLPSDEATWEVIQTHSIEAIKKTPVSRNDEKLLKKHGIEKVLGSRKLYHFMSRAWKLENPAYGSCMQCLHKSELGNMLGDNGQVVGVKNYCPVKKRMQSKIVLYYPENNCEYFEEAE
jgi:hypothetical protein